MKNIRTLLLAGTVGLASSICAAQDIICFEAETVEKIAAPMQVGPGDTTAANAKWPEVKGASGNAYVEVPEGKGKPPEVTTGTATWTFHVDQAGTYLLWARVWWLDECGNSLTMSVNEHTPFTFGQDATYKRWHWVKAPYGLKQLKLTPGPATLTIKNREDGVRIDQILLSADKRYVPVGIEDTTDTAE